MSANCQGYHSETFRILGHKPHVSIVAERLLRDAEDRLGTTLPQSVWQWYGRSDSIQILAEHSNDDPPIAIERFAIVDWQSRRLLPIRHENQGVCTWAIGLDGPDDPPVYVDVDSGGKEWQLLAATFSKYVLSCVWDYRMVFHQPALVQAQNGVLSDSALGALTSSFHHEIQTHGWPRSTQYRFVSDGGAILIWASERETDWFIGSVESDGLERVLRKIWDFDAVGKALYDNTPLGKIALENLRVP